MLRGMSAKQFREWQMFVQLEPFEEDRTPYRFALITQILANANRNSKKRPTPFTLDECTFRFGDEPRPQAMEKKRDWQSMKSVAKAMTASYAEGST